MFRLFVLMSVLIFSVGCDQSPFLTQLTLDDDVEIEGSKLTYHLDGTRVEIEGTEYELTGEGYINIALPSDEDVFDPDPPVSDEYPDAHFVITETFTAVNYGTPYVLITVKNIGNKTGWSVTCDVYAKKGNTLVDKGWTYFARGKNHEIKSGEKVSSDAIFFNLDSHDEYDILEYQLSWLTE